jgi:hypothetical protein
MRIKKSKLLMTFEALCAELETRQLRDIDICAMHTRFVNQTAYTLSVSSRGLFAVLAQADSPRCVKLITTKIEIGKEKESKVKIHVVPDNAIQTLAYITSHFFYDEIRDNPLEDLQAAFGGMEVIPDNFRTDTRRMDMTGFLS